MIAIAHRPVIRELPLDAEPRLPATGAAARTLARSYLRYVSAVWRGDQSGGTFAAWLDQFWTDNLPPPPGSVPDAFSPHGGGGHGICWFETGDDVLGFVPGAVGGYRVPVGALVRMPSLPAYDGMPVRQRPLQRGRGPDPAGLCRPTRNHEHASRCLRRDQR